VSKSQEECNQREDGTLNEKITVRSGFIWGDQIDMKKTKTIRIGLANIGGIPINHKKIKNKRIMTFLKTLKFDVFGIPEVNLHWKLLPSDSQLSQRTTPWFTDIKASTAYYEDFQVSGPKQYGGTTQWALESAAHRITATGQDKTGLGRWVWQRM
jgi:hypothetical protein